MSKVGKKLNSGVFSSNEDTWNTPWELYRLLDDLFHFKLDAAASESNAKCKSYFTVDDNALFKLWDYQSVFCNPPYSNIEVWTKKAWQESKRGNTVVLLIPARVETDYYFDYIWPYENGADVGIVFPDRIKFTFMGIKKGTSPFPSIAHVFNPEATGISYLQIKNHFYGLARCLDLKADGKIERLERRVKELEELNKKLYVSE